MECPKCGGNVPDGVAFCGLCGRNLADVNQQRIARQYATGMKLQAVGGVLIWGLVVVIVAAVLWALIAS